MTTATMYLLTEKAHEGGSPPGSQDMLACGTQTRTQLLDQKTGI